jgi:hypothetical protein
LPEHLKFALLRLLSSGPAKVPLDSAFLLRAPHHWHTGNAAPLPPAVTAPPNASARPFSVAPLFTVIEVSANMFPCMTAVVSIVAELPTCQKILEA